MYSWLSTHDAFDGCLSDDEHEEVAEDGEGDVARDADDVLDEDDTDDGDDNNDDDDDALDRDKHDGITRDDVPHDDDASDDDMWQRDKTEGLHSDSPVSEDDEKMVPTEETEMMGSEGIVPKTRGSSLSVADQHTGEWRGGTGSLLLH